MCISGMNLTKDPYGEKEVEKGVKLWKQIAKKFQNLETDYDQVMEEAKSLSLTTRIPKPKKADKKEFYGKYDVQFLKKKTEAEAREYLLGLTPKAIRNEISRAEDMRDDFYYVTKRNIIEELNIRIKAKNTAGKTIYGAPQAQKL